MPIFRLAYIALFLLALIAVFTLWSQVGGQAHLDLVPWSVKLGLGSAAALGITRASMSAVQGEHGWNGQSVKWTGLTLAALFLCGMASLYAHNNLEETGDDSGEGDATVSSAAQHHVTLETYAQGGGSVAGGPRAGVWLGSDWTQPRRPARRGPAHTESSRGSGPDSRTEYDPSWYRQLG
jgi:hypothetical protein